jgi:hypothetical protein
MLLLARSFQQVTKIRNLLIAACCAALVASVTVAYAQTASPAKRHATKTGNSMISNAKMKKKHHKMKKTTKSGDSIKDLPKGDTKDAK